MVRVEMTEKINGRIVDEWTLAGKFDDKRKAFRHFFNKGWNPTTENNFDLKLSDYDEREDEILESYVKFIEEEN